MRVIRYRVKPGQGDENARLIREVFEGLERERPSGLRYRVFQLEDGEFLHVVDGENSQALRGLAAFERFQYGLAGRTAEAPVVRTAEALGAYGEPQ